MVHHKLVVLLVLKQNKEQTKQTKANQNKQTKPKQTTSKPTNLRDLLHLVPLTVSRWQKKQTTEQTKTIQQACKTACKQKY
jgi:hypothetical protein